MVYNMLSTDSAVKRHVLAGDSDQLPFGSMSSPIPGEDSTLGDRLTFAIRADHHQSQTATESALMAKYPDVFRSRGFLSSYISGRRGAKAPDPKAMKLIADFLHVQFEWLMLGSGPVRRDGRDPLNPGTPFEQAIFVARTWGIRSDAWDVAWERNKDRAETLTEIDWMALIRDEGQRLDRAGIPRPDDVVAATKRREIKEYAGGKRLISPKTKEIGNDVVPAKRIALRAARADK